MIQPKKKAELEELNQEKENTLQIIENSKNGLKNLEKDNDKKIKTWWLQRR